MADVEIRGKISVDTGNTQKSVNEMLESIKQTKKALSDAKVGSKEYKDAQAQLKKQTDDLNKTMDQSSGSFGKLKNTLGATVPGFQGASAGASGLGKQLWLLVANPIVAVIAGIVAALTLLYKAFTSTNAGADKLEQVMSGIGAAMDVLRDRVLAVAKAIGEFFSGDFKKALETGKAAVSGIGQEIADEFPAAANATKTLQDLADTMRELTIGRAELNRDLAKAKEIMSDADASFAERRAALIKVRDLEAVQNKKELDAAEAQYKEIARLNTLSDTSNEDLAKEAAAKVRMIDLQTSSANQLRSLNRMDKQLTRDENQKAAADQKILDDKKITDQEAKDKAEKARMTKYLADLKLFGDDQNNALMAGIELEKEIDAEKDLLNQKEIERASSLALIRKTNHDQDKARKEQEKADDQALIDFKLAVYSQQLNGLAMLGNVIQQFAGKSKAAMTTGIIIEKAAAIGQILISGFQANAKSMAASPLTLGQPFVGIQNVITGLQIAGTVKAASNAIKQVGGSDTTGAGSIGSISASAPLSPQQSSTSLNAGSIQGVGNAASGGVNRTFVLDADIKSNQERQARISRAARLS